jgi:putative DNA primase/helicase
MDVFVHILGSFCLAATGGTSAAGLRQSLASDALPVLFDEAEGDSGRASDNIAAVLSLMRHSSAALEAKVFKGGADGHASSSIVRSCFLLAAIRDPLIQAADKSRVTVFNLKASSRESAEHWKSVLVPLANAMMEPGYAERLRGRVFANITTLLEAIDVFSDACTGRFGDRRMGDQIGAMLGGVWLLTEDGVPTEAEATRRVGMMRWDDQIDTLAEASDEEACLAAILSAHVRVDGDGWHGEASIAGLINEVRFPGASDQHFSEKDAKRTLGMYGIRVEIGTDSVLVSNTNGMLQRKIMAHTPWPHGWGKLLGRVTGAKKRDTVVEIAGCKSRVTAVPLAACEGDGGS